VCELKVHVDSPRGDERVAEDVVYARVEADHVLLRDVLGATHKISDALISTIDIGKESLFLRQSSIIAPFLRFLEAWQNVETTRNYAEAEESWNDLKAKGDEIVRSLWRKYRGSP
jgi:predicted RNA-binding protein